MRFVFLFAAFALLACDRGNVSAAEPTIEVQPLALDFGPVPMGLRVSLPVQVRNLGRSTLVLQPATSSDAQFSGNEAVVEVGAGERATVEVTFLPSGEAVHTAEVHLLNNSVNDADVAIAVTGQGTARLVCAECNTPPDSYCASGTLLISYQPHGVCVGDRCEYQATSTICGGSCLAAEKRCSGPVSGTDAGSDAGTPVDAGTDAGQPVDAGATGALFVDAGVHQWTVPAGFTSVTVKAWGGGGAGGVQQGSTGGGAAAVTATLAVTPGETLELQVAEGGRAPGSGGGATSVLRGTDLLLRVAGGGGGGSDGNSGNHAGGRGGAGGTTAGQAGANFTGTIYQYCTSATGGQGGTQTAGGAGGTSTGTASTKCPGQPGQLGAGGRATGVNGTCDVGPGANEWRQGGGQGNGGGGAGGAGYFGGGGAGFIWTYCSGGGGGGSSFVAPGATAVQQFAGQDRAQGNVAESQGAGAGGFDGVGGLTNADGKPGRVELSW
jgi:hypothetical protein